jgi:hypothetical protein
MSADNKPDIKFPLELKKNEDGYVVLNEEGKPLYIDQNKQEVALDAAELWGDLKMANSESKERRLKIQELENSLTETTNSFNELTRKFDGLDPEKAKKAIETVKNYTDKQMVDAGEVERIKSSAKEGYEALLKEAKDSYENALMEKEKAIKLKESQIRDQLVRGAFDRSDFLRDKTYLFPSAAFSYFGDYFTIEEKNGKLTAVGKIDDKPIISKANPGEIASPEEAIEILVNRDPQRDRILRTDGAGGGMSNPGARTNDKEKSLAETLYPTMFNKER